MTATDKLFFAPCTSRSLACMYSNRTIIISKSWHIGKGNANESVGDNDTRHFIGSQLRFRVSTAALFASIAEQRSIRNIAVDRGAVFALSKARRQPALHPEGTTTRVPRDPYAIQLLVTSLSCSAVETICPFACPFVSPAQTTRTRLCFNPSGVKRDETFRHRF